MGESERDEGTYFSRRREAQGLVSFGMFKGPHRVDSRNVMFHGRIRDPIGTMYQPKYLEPGKTLYHLRHQKSDISDGQSEKHYNNDCELDDKSRN